MKKPKKEQVDYQNLFQRTLADFENYKKRTEAEKSKWTDEAKVEFVEKLLPVLDNLVLMSTHLPEDLKENSWAQGVGLIAKQIEQTLEEEGISKIDPKAGELFDPMFHEAVSAEELKEFGPDKVLSVQKPGYKIGERIIRVARVTVSK